MSTAELTRIATAGSVDDGKSTLIGRLLYDSKSLFTDQLEAVSATSRRRGDDYTDLPLLTDGLRAEREQGIRRRLSLFRHTSAEVHSGRYTWAHSVHPLHGHRRIDC